MKNEITLNEIKNANQVKLVHICCGESNGRDDSDGFKAYADLISKKVYFYQWTTRFGCDMRTPAHVMPTDLTPAELAAYKKIITDFAAEWLSSPNKQTGCGSEKHGTFIGIPCIVDGGRKYRGEGELIGIATTYYTYGYSRGWGRGRKEVENTKATIKTPDGSVKEATAHFVKFDYSKIDLRSVAARFAVEIISEEGYNRNEVRYSNSKYAGDFVMKFFEKVA